MNFNRSTFQQVARFLTIAFTCAVLLFSNAFPAVAGGMRSKTTEGSTQLNKIIDDSEAAAKSSPPSLKDTQRKAEEGINEVQGSSDANKMKRPDNSKQATSIEEQVGKVMDKVTGDR